MPECLPGTAPRLHGLWLACWLLTAVILPARADIEVSIAAGTDRDAWFLVQTRSNHARLHGSHTHAIDARLMRPGETALKNTRRALQAKFCRAGDGGWLIQLPGGA